MPRPAGVVGSPQVVHRPRLKHRRGAETGVRVVDPMAELEAQVEAGPSSYHVEGHWNGHGHAAALEVLVPALAEVLRAR